MSRKSKSRHACITIFYPLGKIQSYRPVINTCKYQTRTDKKTQQTKEKRENKNMRPRKVHVCGSNQTSYGQWEKRSENQTAERLANWPTSQGSITREALWH